jgi:predicted SAM-dependent methyltransferase
MLLLNLGCGYNYSTEWINLDFVKTGECVTECNLLNGIPFESNSYDILYHSHVLEHFSKSDGERFLRECYRVLKPGGIIRVVVPNLEIIVREYLKNLSDSLNGNMESKEKYDWIMLELFDQTVRTFSGGEMAKYLCRTELTNKDYIYSRIGDEVNYNHETETSIINQEKQNVSLLGLFKTNLKRVYQIPKGILRRTLFKRDLSLLEKEKAAIELGKFRLAGEVHQWMYDRYSLDRLLSDCGFINMEIVTAFQSEIKDWDTYQLDAIKGVVRKPDSLFMEAFKPL